MNLNKIKQLVRKYTGMLSQEQISDDELKEVINDFYCEKLPLLLDTKELYHTYLMQIMQGQRQYDIPEEVLKIIEPVWINDVPIRVIYDRNLFFAIYPLNSDTEAKPEAVLFDKGAIWFSSIPDAEYMLKFTALTKPQQLFEDSDEPLNPAWGRAIAIGSAFYILSERDDVQHALELTTLLNTELGLISEADLRMESQKQIIRRF